MIESRKIETLINRKLWLLFIVSIVVFLLPLLILPFLNFPSTDDFYIPDLMRSMGFWEVQEYVYNNWGARFTFNFLSAFGNFNNFVLENYYLHSLLLILGQLLASVFFVHNLLKYLLNISISASQLWFLGLVFFMVQLVSLPEVSTWYFWFSSAITYSLPTTLVFFQLGLLFRYFRKKEFWSIVVISILIFISIGSNEVFVVIQGIIFFVLAILTFRKKESFGLILPFVLVLGLSAGLYFLSSGNQYRFGIIPSKNPMFYVLSIAVQFPIIFWSIFKNPLFWFFGFTVFMVLKPYQESIMSRFGNNLKYILFAFFAFLILTILIPVIGLKGSMLPLRLVNVLVMFSLLFSLMVFVLFLLKYSKAAEPVFFPTISKYFVAFFILILFANHFTADSYQSLISAYYRSKIPTEQFEAMKRAGEGKGVLIVKNYHCELKEITENKNVTLSKIIENKPKFLMDLNYFENEGTKEFFKNYYQIEKIIIEDCDDIVSKD